MKKDSKVYILLLMVLFISIGYAFLTGNINISGSTIISGNTWDIHFENIQVMNGSTSLSLWDEAAYVDPLNVTTVNYLVTLNAPGDYYEFTVDAKNSGSIDGVIDSISSKINNIEIVTLPEYLEYSVTYDNGNPIEVGKVLEAGEKDIYRIKVKYKDSINSSQLPSSDQALYYSFTINYKQKKSN